MLKGLVLIIGTALPAGLVAARRLRRSGGQERTMTRADLVMAWLNNAYSMETGLVHTLQSHAKDAEAFPQIQARIQQHVEETHRHAHMIKDCIERRGGSPSTLKSGMATVAGKAQGVAMRPAQDRVVKNTLADSSAEQLEISSYRALMAAAHDLGDQETVAICQQILQDEEDMAHFLDENLATLVTETVHRLSAGTS
jgi:ferritin-like metal-binding protein YciE